MVRWFESLRWNFAYENSTPADSYCFLVWQNIWISEAVKAYSEQSIVPKRTTSQYMCWHDLIVGTSNGNNVDKRITQYFTNM